ncbi:MAG TPA: TolC family protein [Gammaproteobacteria bacterium]|nr:TolC family protein [Gammaproteobacteria bacterium]
MSNFPRRGYGTAIAVLMMVILSSFQARAEDNPVSPGAAKLVPGQLVLEVLTQNQSLTAMQAAADAANARTESADALPDPMLSYAAAPNSAGYSGQGLNFNTQISQVFPWPGTLQLRSDAAKAETESAEQQVADMRLRLGAQARALYADWYYVHQALDINSQNLALLARLQAVAETQYAAGQVPEQDVLQAEVELTRLKNQQLELERRRRTIQAKIDGLLNVDPDIPVAPPADIPPPQTLPRYAALQRSALARYPQLKSLDAQIRAARERVKLADTNNYPSFTLMAGYNSLWDPVAKRLIVGMSINIPFGGNHRGKVSETQARLHESEARLSDARAQLLSALDQAYETATQTDATIKLYTDKLLPLAELNLKASEADYANGSGDFLKLITAERQYLMAKLELARARADFYIQLTSLNYQTGGALLDTPAATPLQDAMP